MRLFLRTLAILLVLGLVAGITFYFEPLWVNDQVIHWHMRRQHVLSEYVMVDGTRIHYYEAPATHHPGKLPEKPIVLIHGLGARAEDWSAMIPTLAAQGFHVYALDLPGYGRSGKPDADYSIRFEEQAVVDFMHAVHLTTADVGGWSMGGWIALKLAVDHPEVVDRLVVYDSAGIYFPATYDASLFSPTDAAGLTRLQAMLSPDPKPLPGFAVRAAIRKLQGNAPIIQKSVTSMKGGKDLLDFQLHTIRKPTLIVWGKQDVLIPPSVGYTMHRDIQGSSLLLVDGCGHLAPAECWRPVSKATLDFLRAPQPLPATELTVAGK